MVFFFKGRVGVGGRRVMCQFLLCIYHLLYHLLYHLKNILLHALYCLELNITCKRHCMPSCPCFSSFFHFMFSLNSWVSCYCRCNWITLCCTFIIIKIIYKSCTSNNSIKFDFTIEGLCYMEKKYIYHDIIWYKLKQILE